MLTYIVSAVVIIAAIYSLILLLFLGLGRASAMEDEELVRAYRRLRDGAE
jgi:hypothetical protein